jgi:hypothetical protein
LPCSPQDIFADERLLLYDARPVISGPGDVDEYANEEEKSRLFSSSSAAAAAEEESSSSAATALDCSTIGTTTTTAVLEILYVAV